MDTARQRPLKVGLLFATWDNPTIDIVVRWKDVRERILRAEELGFDSVWIVDHFLFRHLPEATFGLWDGWSPLAAIAERPRPVWNSGCSWPAPAIGIPCS